MRIIKVIEKSEYGNGPDGFLKHAFLEMMQGLGWEMHLCPVIKKNWPRLSCMHYRGIRGNAVCHVEFTDATEAISSVRFLYIGHLKNEELADASKHIWPLTDSRAKPLSYLERKKVELEHLRVSKALQDMGFSVRMDTDWQKDPVAYIIEKEAINRHIHGGATTLEEIGRYIEKRNYEYHAKHNAVDQDGKYIECGQTKYFYSKGRLMRGQVWHNINNMWWVLLNKGCRNVCCHDLFDYDPQRHPRRKPEGPARAIRALESQVDAAVKNKDFLAAHAKQQLITKILMKQKKTNELIKEILNKP